MKGKENIPSESMLFDDSKKYDYSDSFSVSLQRQDVESWELVAAFFLSTPKWVDNLFVLRNKLVSAIGLKAAMADLTQLNPPYKKGQQFGVFRILEMTDNEVVLGENDKHLDFRTSLFIERGIDDRLVVSTIVKINNYFGKVYFFIVKRVHQIIVPIMVKRMVKNIDGKLLPQYADNKT